MNPIPQTTAVIAPNTIATTRRADPIPTHKIVIKTVSIINAFTFS